MEKIMLIAGCSHAAGSEIDGTGDSDYNRHNSFGSKLAMRMGYRPLNIAVAGSTNSAIARSVLKWFEANYNPKKMKVFVVIAWTDSTRMEIPYDEFVPMPDNDHINWMDVSTHDFFKITLGWEGNPDKPSEKEQINYYHKFILDHEQYLAIQTLNYALQLQYFLNSKKVDYVMCNSMQVYTNHTKQLGYYLSLIDETKYYGIYNTNQAFYWKYKNEGYTNPKATYWHHDEVPHDLFANELYNFIEDNK